MGHALGGLRVSLGHREGWIGVPVQCYTECNIELHNMAQFVTIMS